MAEAARDAATATVTAARVASRDRGAVHVHAEVASPDRKVAAITCVTSFWCVIYEKKKAGGGVGDVGR